MKQIDRIRNMNAEELAMVLSDVCKYLCMDSNDCALCNERHSSCFSALCDTLESEVEE